METQLNTLSPLDILDIIAKVLTILTIIGGLLYAFYRWLIRQNGQDKDIEATEKHVDEVEDKCEKHIVEVEKECVEKIDCLKGEFDEKLHSIQAEQALMCYGLLAALKGLQEQGCNGPVTTAIEKFEKHLNVQAHK